MCCFNTTYLLIGESLRAVDDCHVLVGVGRVCLFFDWLHQCFPGHVLGVSAVRVDARDEEPAAIILDIVNIASWRLLLL